MASPLYELVVTALLCASVATWILLDAGSVYQLLRKIKLYVSGVLLMVFGRDKRWRRKPPREAAVKAMKTEKSKRLLFLRHGESEWNLIFNKGPKPLVPFKAVAALAREARLFLALDSGSVLYDSPLNQEGLEQAQELAGLLRDGRLEGPDAAALRGDAEAYTSVVTSSNMRRALQTCVVALQQRLGLPGQRVHVLSSLQEVSTNIDTIALAGPGELPQLPRVPAALRDPKRFELGLNAGSKPLSSHGGRRLAAFARWALARPEECVIVAGHSLWFQSFFREYLPAESQHDAKAFKVANGGVVACVLESGTDAKGKRILAVRPESVVAVHKGFDVKKRKDKKV